MFTPTQISDRQIELNKKWNRLEARAEKNGLIKEFNWYKKNRVVRPPDDEVAEYWLGADSHLFFAAQHALLVLKKHGVAALSKEGK